MTAHNVKYRGKDVNIEIGAERSVVDGEASRNDILEALKENRHKYYLKNYGSVMTSKRKAVSIEAQLQEWNERVPVGNCLFVLPLDETIYYAKAEATEHYVAILQEGFALYDELLAIKEQQRDSKLIVVEGGTLTEKVSTIADINEDLAGNDLVVHILPSKTTEQYTFQEISDAKAFLKPLLLAGSLIVAYFILTNIDFKKEEVIEKIEPKVASNAGKQMVAFGELVTKSEKLIAHGVRTITYRNGAVAIEGILNPGETDIDRLIVIADEIGGSFQVYTSGWVIANIPLRFKLADEESLHPIRPYAIALQRMAADYPLDVRLGTERRLEIFTQREDTITDERKGINGKSIVLLGEKVDSKQFPAALTQANVERNGNEPVGGWKTAKYQLRFKGVL